MKTGRLSIRLSDKEKEQLQNKQKLMGFKNLSSYVLFCCDEKRKTETGLSTCGLPELNSIVVKLEAIEQLISPNNPLDKIALKHIYEIRVSIAKALSGGVK